MIMVGAALPPLPPLTARHWFFIIQHFEQLALALKNRVAPNFFTVLKYFYLSWLLSNLCLPWKDEFALKFFSVLKYFLSFMAFEHLVLALKTMFALNFSSWGGGGRPPASYATSSAWLHFDETFAQPDVFAVINCPVRALSVFYSIVNAQPYIFAVVNCAGAVLSVF